MKVFADTCVKIVEELKQIEIEIKKLEADLKFFEEKAACWPGEQIHSRLLTFAEAIEKESSRLMAEHSGQGCTWFRTGSSGISFVMWANDKSLADDKEYWQAEGISVLFPAEMLELINRLITELGKGNWVPAVTWLNNHRLYFEKSGRPL